MKSKIISFRLSAAEYTAVQQMSETQGCASVALFARSAVLRNSCVGGCECHSSGIDTRSLRQSLQAITVALDTVAATLHVVVRAFGEPRTGSAQGSAVAARSMELNIA